MRIAFLDTIEWDYSPETPFCKPLGGTQSAVCYLMMAMQKQGHEIFLINNTKIRDCIRNIYCIPFSNNLGDLRDIFRKINVDFLIIISAPSLAKSLRPILSKATKIYLWTGHAHNQPALNGLEIDEVKNSLFVATHPSHGTTR